MLAGSVIGVPGPVAMMRPPCTWRPSSAVAGRFNPTLVRSSPSSGAMSTRSPTTMRRLGASSGMGNSIQPSLCGRRGGPALLEGRHPAASDVAEWGRRSRWVLDRAKRRTINSRLPQTQRGRRSASSPGRDTAMQNPVGIAQTEQWSWILQTVWGWIWGGLSWIIDWQALVFRTVLFGDSFWQILGKFLLLFFPATVLIAGVWGTMVSLYTIPFRSGRGRFLAALVMSWWDAVRMAWFYWFGLVRFLLVFVGWIWGLLRLGVGLLWRTLKNLVTSPFAMLDSSSRQPGVPWIAFVLLLFWSAIEATIFTFTLRPTMSELLADLTGYQVNALALVVILWFFLFIIIGGSFACIQVLNEAIKTRAVGQIVAMVLVEITVALFEVLFLYRELIDAITPWLAQQGFQLGIVGTLGLALLGWVGVRGMTWFLFGRFGTPALLAILGRKAMEGQQGAARPSAAADLEYWRGPINALKAEHEWFKKEAQHLMELLTLPVLQLVASGFNFLVVVIMGKPHFNLPFRSLDQVLHSTPIFQTGKTSTVEGGAS